MRLYFRCNFFILIFVSFLLSNLVFSRFLNDIGASHRNTIENDVMFNHLQSFGENDVINGADESSPSEALAPLYMIELYEKFEQDKYSLPMSNTVRSFVNVYRGMCIRKKYFHMTYVRVLYFFLSGLKVDQKVKIRY